MADVYLHVGLPKTGTTSIQLALTAHSADLAEAGVLFPGGRHIAQRRAVYDLLGQRMAGDNVPITGAFERVTAEMAAYGGRTIVFSEEALGRARVRDARRLVRALEGHRVFVVVTVRDLPRMLTSAWQQSVVMGSEVEWPDFLRSVREPGRGTVSVAATFWLKHDVMRALDVWGTVVPADRVVLVTVPPPGAGPEVLFERFGHAVGVPADLWAGGARNRNVGLGAVETEVIRRLNGHLGDRLSGMPYRWTIEDGIRRDWPAQPPRTPPLTTEDLAWARERSERVVAELSARGHRVVGDLADLVPTRQPTDPAPVTEAELLASTEQALASLAAAYGAQRTRHRRARRAQGQPVSRASAVRSATAAAAFRMRRSALAWSDRVPPLAWLARRVTGLR